MKSIRLSGTTAAMASSSEVAPNSGQLATQHKDFRSSWPGDENVNDRRAEPQSDKTVTILRNPAAKNSEAESGIAPSMVEHARESNAANAISVMPGQDPSGARSMPVKTGVDAFDSSRRDHSSEVSGKRRTEKLKQGCDSKADASRSSHEGSAVASGISSGASEGVTVLSSVAGLPGSGRHADAPKSQELATEPMSSGGLRGPKHSAQRAEPNGEVAQATENKGEIVHGKPGESSGPATNTPSATKAKDEVKDLIAPGGTLSIASELRAGSPGAEHLLQASQLTHSPLASGRYAGAANSTSANTSITSAVPQMIAATPVRLDVGVLNETHGWLRIRAELGSGGAVNASVTGIDSAQEALRSTVPEMSSYLGTESVKVNSIEVHRFGDGSGTFTAMAPDDQSNRERQSDEQGDGARQQTGESVPPSLLRNAIGMSSGSDVRGGNGARLTSAAVWDSGYTGRGTWLSVCA
jgi:hypothetical protein